MVVARGSLHCASHFNHKEIGPLPFFFARLDPNSSRDSFGTCKGENSVVFRGMLTTLNVSKLVHLRQFKFCMDLSLNSSEQGTRAGSKMGEGQFLLSQACYKLILNSALSTMPSYIFVPYSLCVYRFCCSFFAHFCCHC